MSVFRQNALKIHEAMSDSERPPRAPTARMIATGPVQAKRKATNAVAAYEVPKSSSTCRRAMTGRSGRSSSMGPEDSRLRGRGIFVSQQGQVRVRPFLVCAALLLAHGTARADT